MTEGVLRPPLPPRVFLPSLHATEADVYFKQFYLGCLSQASYLVGSQGVALVVDPQRDVQVYLDEARAAGLAIRYILETHLHADFVSGHRELAERTGATILVGRKAAAGFPHRAVGHGDEIALGSVTLRILETPGHTPDSLCVLVSDTDEPATAPRLLTGDTLFIGDVGRPDLSGGRGFTPRQMAEMLYDSLHTRVLTLDDAVEVWPAHGAGSLCGKNLSKESSSTIGQQRRLNYALQPMEKEAFVAMMTADLPPAPAYFPKDAEINRAGAAALDTLPRPVPLSPAAFEERVRRGAFVLDVRPGAAFGAGHIPGAVNIGLSGQFASWAGSVIPIGTPILLVAETEAMVAEARTRLARVGHDLVEGFLEGGMPAWAADGRPLAALPQIPVEALRARLAGGPPLAVIDVRGPGEYEAGHVPSAVNVPLPALLRGEARAPGEGPLAVVCQSGYRSSLAASLLMKGGRSGLLNVSGGTTAWMESESRLADPAPTPR